MLFLFYLYYLFCYSLNSKYFIENQLNFKNHLCNKEMFKLTL